MKVEIGNVGSGSDVKITYSFYSLLDVEASYFWSFKMASTFTSRFNNSGPSANKFTKDLATIMNYPTIAPNDSNAYPWFIHIKIQSPAPIELVRSPTHQIKTKYSVENHCCEIDLDPKISHKPTMDFELIYSNGKENEPGYQITPLGEDEGYCAMVRFLPNFDA